MRQITKNASAADKSQKRSEQSIKCPGIAAGAAKSTADKAPQIAGAAEPWHLAVQSLRPSLPAAIAGWHACGRRA